MSIFVRNKKLKQQNKINTKQIEKIQNIIKKYGFLKNKNFEMFTTLLKNKELKKAEKLLTERFQIQKKHQPEKLAKKTMEKLYKTT